MSADGASEGINAKNALRVVLGGEAVEDQPTESAEDVRERVLTAARRGGEATDYGDAADRAAGMILLLAESRPEIATWSAERTYEWLQADGGWGPDPADSPEGRPVGPDLYGEVNAYTEGKLSDLGLSGFQWGWAVNCAKWILNEPPVPNPAIITISGT